MMAASRDQADTKLRFYNPESAAKTAAMAADRVKEEKTGGFATKEIAGKESAALKEEFKKQRAKSAVEHMIKIIDARSVPGGLGAWNLDTHGFCFVAAPEPVKEFRDKAQIL